MIISVNVNFCSWYLNHIMINCSINPKPYMFKLKTLHIEWFEIDVKIKNFIQYFPDWLRDIACITHFSEKSWQRVVVIRFQLVSIEKFDCIELFLQYCLGIFSYVYVRKHSFTVYWYYPLFRNIAFWILMHSLLLF